MIRIAKQDDSPGIVQLVDRVYKEYGEQIHLRGADADLLDLTTYYFSVGGCFWVLEIGGTIMGSHGALPDSERDDVCRFRRLYLDRSLRGTHWSTDLMQVTLDWARGQKMGRIEFWSDTRFTRAHQFFSKFGFQRDGRQRTMTDGLEPYTEFFFFLDLADLSAKGDH